MQRLLFVTALVVLGLVTTSSQASTFAPTAKPDYCSSAVDCEQCHSRSSVSGECNWCLTSSGKSQGCTRGSCPFMEANSNQCKVPTDWCRSAITCEDCLQRSGSDRSCEWATGINRGYGDSLGCWNGGESPAGAIITYTQRNECPGLGIPWKEGLWAAVGLSTASLVLGALIGFIALIVSFNLSSVRLQRTAFLLWVISFLFWGAALPSVLASMLVIRRRRPSPCCSCSCTWVFLLGITEVCGVLMGYLSGVTLDGLQLASNDPWWSYTFILVIGMPTVLSSILVCGLPRIIISWAISKEKEHDDVDLRSQEPRHSSPPHYGYQAIK